ncbi:MAG: glycosyltransferase [Patescibacteria group bacterium]
MKKPKIAIAHEFFTVLGGAEKVLIELHRAFPDAPIHFLLSSPKLVRQYLPEAHIINSSLHRYPSFLTKHHQLFLWQFPVVTEQFDFSDYDIVISSCNSFIKGIITKPDTIHICYNHSPTRYLWDQAAEWIDSKKLSLFKPLIQWRFNQLRQWDLLASDRVDMFVANSKYVASRIEKYYRRQADRIIYPSVDTKIFRPRTIQKKDYFFMVSRLEPYKKFDLAVKAFNKLQLPLFIAGTGTHEKYLRSIAQDNIKFLGFVSDEEKIKLFQGARAFIFPTEEDFGIVPLESMAAGTPVIAYRQGGVQESVIDKQTGVLFDHQNEQSIIDAVHYFAAHEQKITPQNCLKRAKDFDHTVFAAAIKQIVDYSHHHRQAILDKIILGKKCR